MTARRGAIGLTISLLAAGLIAGCGSSNNSGTGGAGGGAGAAGTSGGTGGKGGTAGTGTGTGGTAGAAGAGTGGKADGGTDARADAPGDTVVTSDASDALPTCGPFADGGLPSDAGVDASANASFFVTSTGSPSANLGGLDAADAKCQTLAGAVGLGGKTWHAYLSVEHGPADGGTGAPVNAKDRIGSGPWFNVKGVMIAANLTDLHNRKGDPTVFIDERGAMIDGQWTGSVPPPKHDVLTGSNQDGTLAVGKTCSDWTSSSPVPDGGAPDGGSLFVARVGHTDGLGPRCSTTPAPQNNADVTSWNSAHDTASCGDIMSRGGVGHIYCFATN
jgi:hypothetical protein